MSAFKCDLKWIEDIDEFFFLRPSMSENFVEQFLYVKWRTHRIPKVRMFNLPQFILFLTQECKKIVV